MSPDAFRRLGLLALSSAYALGLVLVFRYLGAVPAVVVVLVGAFVALAVTLEPAPAPQDASDEREGLSRRAIDRLLRAGGESE